MEHGPKKSAKSLPPKQGIIDHRRAENFESKYSNNVHLEMSTWDLKMTFGELDQSLGPHVVNQHTAMSMPWAYVKILAYLLRLNVLGHEAGHGRIIIPKGLIPEVPKEKPGNLEVPEEYFAAARALYEDFISENPEAAPNSQPGTGSKKPS
jgi:hypothetical protein